MALLGVASAPQPALANPPTLVSRTVVSRAASADVIVGRARCGRTVWLLDTARHLLEISPEMGRVIAHNIQGLKAAEQPWGLACGADRRLWTLASPWVLAHLTDTGTVVERRQLKAPWVELFDGGDGFLFEPAPPVAMSAVLSTATAAAPGKGRVWPGLTTRAAPTRAALVVHNLVSCGLSNAGRSPCWFPDSTDVVISDGLSARRYAFPWIRDVGINTEAPLHDVAIADAERTWLLASHSQLSRGRRVSRRLLLATERAGETARLDLPTPVRLILTANGTSCVLLTDEGDLLEVRVR